MEMTFDYLIPVRCKGTTILFIVVIGGLFMSIYVVVLVYRFDLFPCV